MPGCCRANLTKRSKVLIPKMLLKDRICLLVLLAGLRLSPVALSAPFAIQGPGVNPADFRITVFATNLYFPLGMARLADGSMLVGVSQGANFWSSSVGQILRLTDTNRDGIADGPGTILYSGLPGGQSSLRVWGKLIFVTGQGVGRPISILRMGATPEAALT